MALNFSAEQYEDAYKPTQLSQWEVPKKFKECPKRRAGCTTPLTDEHGRLCCDVEKPKFKEWSSFDGTWGKDYSRPGAVLGTPIKPGVWMIKGRRARWIEAAKIESEKYMYDVL